MLKRGINRALLVIRVITTLMVMIWALPLVALDPEVHPTQYSLRGWSTEDGLPQNTVQTILQGHRGYLWFATQEGLARFDGINFRVWDTHSTPALPARNVRTLFEDQNNRLWIGMRGGGGLARLDPDGTLHTTFFTDMPTTEVRCLLEDARGRLWIGTRGHGLFRLDPGATTPERIDAVTSTLILDLEIDHDGGLWIATEGDGVWHLESDRVEHLTTDQGLPHNNVWTIFLDSTDRLWLGTFGGGLARYEDGVFTTLTKADGLSSDRISGIHEDHDHNLWIGTYRGLNRLTNGAITAITRDDGLGDDLVISIGEDREGNLWVGTAAAGVVRLKDSPFTVFDSGSEGIGGMPRVVLEEPGRGIWVGTSNGGLQLIRDGKIQATPLGARQPENDVFALHLASDGALWVGSYGAGITRFYEGRRQHWTTTNGLPNDTVWSIGETSDGTIWVGTYGGGLAAYSNEEWSVLTTEDGLATNLIRSLHTGTDGTLWIGTSGGICSLKDHSIACLTPADGLTNPSVLSIYEDDDGRIWVGTNGGGVSLLTSDGIRSVTTADGLFDDVIYRMLPDDDGRLWMSCNRGIFGVDATELLERALGGNDPLTYRALGRWDGMATDECNGGSQPAGWRSEDGLLWFPTVQGVVAFDPRQLPTIPEPPEVLISEVVIDGTVVPSAPVIVPADAGTLEVHFTATSFVAPERLRFRYRFSDLSDGWTDAGRRRIAFFTHLPHGAHTLEIVAGYADGTWSRHSTRLEITVEPRLFQTVEFLVLTGVALIALGFGVASLRTAAIRHRERILAQQVEERTGELLQVTQALENANLRLEELSLEDPLTKVSNRRSFDQALNQLWARAQREHAPIAMLMIDVDHFKAFNDTYGHAKGDQCLRQLAGILKGGLRRANDLLARYGGEEFAVLVPDCDAATATGMAETLRRLVEKSGIPHRESPTTGVVTISIGTASTLPERDQSPDDLCLAADAALYRAKSRGRNRVEAG
ncbi:MAG: diguanylate cyclase [Acidobacteria bacterium]|nr:diguanylate cyclase [Acidobacteriota bacterium]